MGFIATEPTLAKVPIHAPLAFHAIDMTVFCAALPLKAADCAARGRGPVGGCGWGVPARPGACSGRRGWAD